MSLACLLLLVCTCQNPPAELPKPADLLARFEKEKRPVWADGETLTFFYRGEADKVSVVFGGDMLAMKRLPQSDLWHASTKKNDIAHCFFSYAFVPTREGQTDSPKLSFQEWRGPDAPPSVEEVKTLQGKITEHELKSQAMGMMRKITVYQPPAGAGNERPRVLYMADGQAATGFAHVIEPLIIAKKIPPLVIVGVHNGSVPRKLDSKETSFDPKQDNRAREYLPQVDPEYFLKHETFFCDEVLPWAEHTLGVSRQREDRGVYGQSNSARFAYTMGVKHPDLFGHIFAFSVAGKPEPVPALQILPTFHLTAGAWEKGFLKLTQTLADELAAREIPVCFITRTSGHDTALWKLELAAALPRAWGATPAPRFDATKLPIPFRRFTTIDRYGRTIIAYLSDAPKDASKPLPLVLWIGGSGSQSLFQKLADGRITGGIQNLLLQMAKGRYRLLCVEKPGVTYLDWLKQPGSATEGSAEFRREQTLPRWAEANAAALRSAWQLPGIDRSRTLVMGHSEGALTASRVAAELPEVTHVAPLASAGATQLHGLVELAAQQASSPEEANQLRDKVFDEWKLIMAQPAASDKFWMGHPYRRWSSFCRHNSVNELLRSRAKLYLAQGTEDKSSHISELDVLHAELAAHGREAQIERIIGVDHGYRPVGKDQPPGPPKEMMALFERVLTWFLK